MPGVGWLLAENLDPIGGARLHSRDGLACRARCPGYTSAGPRVRKPRQSSRTASGSDCYLPRNRRAILPGSGCLSVFPKSHIGSVPSSVALSGLRAVHRLAGDAKQVFVIASHGGPPVGARTPPGAIPWPGARRLRRRSLIAKAFSVPARRMQALGNLQLMRGQISRPFRAIPMPLADAELRAKRCNLVLLDAAWYAGREYEQAELFG